MGFLLWALRASFGNTPKARRPVGLSRPFPDFLSEEIAARAGPASGLPWAQHLDGDGADEPGFYYVLLACHGEQKLLAFHLMTRRKHLHTQHFSHNGYAIMMREGNDIKDCGNKEKLSEILGTRQIRREKRRLGATLTCRLGPRFLVYVSCALSIWGDRMWHFALSVFLIELYGRNLLLTAVFGLVVAGSVLVFGVLIGDWIDRKPRNKVAHASLFLQNSSVTACCVVLMLVFSYKSEIEGVWQGWLMVACYVAVIILADLANLASTALTITIQRDWIVVITGDNRSQLAGMNAMIRRMDQIINIFAPLSVGQVMTWASNVIGCGFILGWNLVSLLVEFLFLSKVYQFVPQLAAKPRRCTGDSFLKRQLELVSSQGEIHSCPAMDEFADVPKTLEAPEDQPSPLEAQQDATSRFPLGLGKMRRLVRTCCDGWKTYCRQTVFLAGLGLAFLYTTVLGFDCITTGYAYTQGIGGSLLSLLMAISAFSGLVGTLLFTRLRRSYGLVHTGIISSCLHIGCLLLCVFSVFAPGSPFDLGIFSLPLSQNSSLSHKMQKGSPVHGSPFERNINQPILPAAPPSTGPTIPFCWMEPRRAASPSPTSPSSCSSQG
ncbi:solute carrier family 40 member 1-like [Antechinus flavipes]|uniref:solute carrier family 40 member 1-like n=1 Tax=Antechinus flavipes TaxID=38775 RepID=UPI0022358E96|nr:solute carrier family 40 member 1-like [Antechinus flavipes]